MRRVAVTVLVLALVAGTTTAFALTQSLKLRRSPVTKPVFDRHLSPTCDCAARVARLAFVLRKADALSATIVDAGGDEIRTLTERTRRDKGKVELVWNGRSDGGTLVPDGRYQLRVHLDAAHRTIVMPPVVIVDTRAPRGRILGANRETISPDGDRRADKVRLRFRSSEQSSALFRVNGIVVNRSRFGPAGVRTVTWNGHLAGRPARAGAYRLSLRFVDQTGNLSEPTDPVRVRVRYVEVTVQTRRVPRGGTLRFAIESDARFVPWTLRKGRKVVLSGRGAAQTSVVLPRRLRRGAYALHVELNGHVASARVRIARHR